MIIYNSILRLRRTPLKTSLFLILLTAASTLVCIGGNLWSVSVENMREFNNIFMTIGTVEQKPEKVEKAERWDAGKETYQYYNVNNYGESIPLSVLDFTDAGYLSGPEQRAYYNAYVPDYKIIPDNAGWGHSMVVEASPVENCVPAGPVKMEIKDVLYSYYPVNATQFYYCDHYSDKPERLYKDKTYIMYVQDFVPHGWPVNSEDESEYIPAGSLSTTQSTREGKRIPNNLPETYIEEITEDFYKSENYKMWKALAEEVRMSFYTVPVTATNDVNLMMSFYTGAAYIEEGALFSQKDYTMGNKVCLISREFARMNDISVGDLLPLPLRYGNYAESASTGGRSGLLNARGEAYAAFEEGDYTVQGIYNISAGITTGLGYMLADNEVIIPAASIKNSNENNIAAYGPMKGYTTSFRIANGSIDEFMDLWKTQGIDNLELNFYDKGFSKLEAELNNRKKMALILLVTGSLAAVLVLIFFSHIFITRQKKGTAIERSLGMRKGQCAVSLLSGIMLIVVIGSLIGCILGYLFTERAAQTMDNVVRYDERYSAGVMGNETGQEETVTSEGSIRVTVMLGGILIVLAVGISSVGVFYNINKEPLMLLSEKD